MYVLKFRLNSACMLVSDGSTQACQSLMGMSVTDGACQSPMRLQSGVLVSNEACRGLQWVSYQAYQSLMGNVSYRSGM